MDEALVVYDEDGIELMEEAGELAAGVDAHLTVVALMTGDEYEETRETLDIVGREEQTDYSDDVVLDAARNEAEEALKEAYDDLDVDWDVVGARIGDGESAADRILEVADSSGADHVFVAGKSRSPTGKAVFGDRTQSVILRFDGPVTTLVE
ncbi:MAG: universal stress protein [Haloarculaceae archaeon]